MNRLLPLIIKGHQYSYALTKPMIAHHPLFIVHYLLPITYFAIASFDKSFVD